MEAHGSLHINVLDSQSAFQARCDLEAGHDVQATAEPLILRHGVVIPRLKAENLSNGSHSAQGQSPVAGETVSLASVEGQQSEVQREGLLSYLGAPVQCQSSHSFRPTSELAQRMLSYSNFNIHSTPGRNSS